MTMVSGWRSTDVGQGCPRSTAEALERLSSAQYSHGSATGYADPVARHPCGAPRRSGPGWLESDGVVALLGRSGVAWPTVRRLLWYRPPRSVTRPTGANW